MTFSALELPTIIHWMMMLNCRAESVRRYKTSIDVVVYNYVIRRKLISSRCFRKITRYANLQPRFRYTKVKFHTNDKLYVHSQWRFNINFIRKKIFGDHNYCCSMCRAYEFVANYACVYVSCILIIVVKVAII